MRWKVWVISLSLLFVGAQAEAFRSKKPQTFTNLQDTNQLSELNNTLSDMWNIQNGRYTLENLITNPQDTRKGVKGDLVYATFGSNDHLCVNTSFPEGFDWTCINIGTLSTCPGGSDGQVQFNDNGNCGGDAGFLWEKNLNRLAIDGDGTATIGTVATLAVGEMPTSGAIILSDDAIDGDVVNLLLTNSLANSASSTNETAQIRFGFGDQKDVARMRAGKVNDYTSTNKTDSFLDFWTESDDVLAQKVTIGANNSSGIMGIGITGHNPADALDVNGGVSVGNDNAIGAPVNGGVLGIYSSGPVHIGSEGASPISTGTMLYVRNDNSPLALGSSLAFEIEGQDSFATPAIIFLGSNSQQDIGRIQINKLLSGAGSPSDSVVAIRNMDTAKEGWVAIQNVSRSSVTVEDPVFVVGESGQTAPFTLANQILTLTDGTTIPTQRASVFTAQTLNGVAGGSAETVTSGTTVYISGAPSGTDITITNPMALWVGGGTSFFEGPVKTVLTGSRCIETDANGVLTASAGACDTGGLVTASGVWTPTTNNIQNFGSSSAAEGQYIRIGNVVTGSIQLTVDPTLTATATELELDLPVASNFGATSDAAGSCGGSDVASEVAEVRADATSDELEILWVTTSLASHEISCAFSYEIK